MSEQNAVVNSA